MRKRFSSITVFISIFICASVNIYSGTAYCKNPTTFDGNVNPYWIKTWGGKYLDVGMRISPIDSDVCVTGYTENLEKGHRDPFILDWDGNGNQKWGISLDGKGYWGSISVLENSSIYVAEEIGDFTIHQGIITRYDLKGNELWEKTLESISEINTIGLYKSDIFVGAFYCINSTTSPVGLLLKYDLNGNQIWEKKIDYFPSYRPYALKFYNNYIYLVGEASNDSLHTELSLYKFDIAGNGVWNKTWKNKDIAPPRSLTIDESGIYVIGTEGVINENEVDSYIVKFSHNGNLLWNNSWGSTDSEVSEDITIDKTGVYVVGDVRMINSNSYKSFLLKYSTDGQYVWGKSWGEEKNTMARAITINADNIFITGRALKKSGSTDYDAFLLKCNTDGGGVDTGYYLPIIAVIIIAVSISVIVYYFKRK